MPWYTAIYRQGITINNGGKNWSKYYKVMSVRKTIYGSKYKGKKNRSDNENKKAIIHFETCYWTNPIIQISIYMQSNEIHNVVALIKFVLALRFQPYMFRTVTVHPQELLCRYCLCRLWYVVRNALPDTSSWMCRIVRFLPRTIVCTHSTYKEAPEDGQLRSETCRAET